MRRLCAKRRTNEFVGRLDQGPLEIFSGGAHVVPESLHQVCSHDLVFRHPFRLLVRKIKPLSMIDFVSIGHFPRDGTYPNQVLKIRVFE
jgi:hypothetical protein